MSGFDTFHFHLAPPYPGVSVYAERARDVQTSRLVTDEAAARFYLHRILDPRSTEDFPNIMAPDGPAQVPELTILDIQDSPVEGNRVVRFRQSHRGIPVFGSRVVVELGAEREFVSVDMKIGRVEVDALAWLSPADAVANLITALKLETFAVAKGPALVFFNVHDRRLLLAYLVEDVPASPLEPWAEAEPPADFRAVTLDSDAPEAYNYLVDATNGDIVFSYPSGPTLDIASLCRGVDDLGGQHEFYGRKVGNTFEMADPDRLVTTHDIRFGEIDGAPTPPPVAAPGADWGESNRAAVSAHVNATRVHDFFEAVLHRDGIDGKGMALVSVVNCTRAGLPTPPEWINAQWRPKEGRMVYGQRQLENGKFQSLATFLDVIAHELTHGITTHTAALVYRAESGALNESLSDIFGVIVNNWYLRGEESNVDDWDWEIGPGLSSDGEPIRDASQPTRRGCPDHMRDYRVVAYDVGGVHINSGIHTLAAVNLLRSMDASGARHFTPRAVAGFYYATLQRLTAQATFAEARKQMVDVVATRYAGFPHEASKKVAAVEAAYDAVGIDPL
ncbi:MAG: M4 family metallopeptidase [Solirubrobacteraceae bacterium]|jgi:Zn-dependent metalloprotease